MSFADLIDTQRKALAALEKRLAAKPSRELAERLGQATIDAKSRRIEARIARLEGQREATVARIDAALASEKAALAAIRKLTPAAPAEPPAPQPGKTEPAKPRREKTHPGKIKLAKVKATTPGAIDDQGAKIRLAKTKRAGGPR